MERYSYQYDDLNQLTFEEITINNGKSTFMYSMIYYYDKNGNLTFVEGDKDA